MGEPFSELMLLFWSAPSKSLLKKSKKKEQVIPAKQAVAEWELIKFRPPQVVLGENMQR